MNENKTNKISGWDYGWEQRKSGELQLCSATGWDDNWAEVVR